MAKTTNKDLDALKAEVPAFNASKTKKVTVKILGTIRASYGAYDEGEIVELDSKIANELKLYGLCEVTKEVVNKKEEEEF